MDDSFFCLEIRNPFFEVIHWNSVDFLSILSQNPDSSLFSWWLSSIFEQSNEVFEHSIKVILWRILSENILDGNKKLVNNSLSMLSCSSDLFDLFWNDSHTFFDTLFISDGNFTNSSDTFFNEFRVDFIHVLFKFFKNRFVIFIVDDSWKDFYFFIFNVIRIRKFGEETFYFILKNWWSLFDNVLNIF